MTVTDRDRAPVYERYLRTALAEAVRNSDTVRAKILTREIFALMGVRPTQ